MACNYDHYTSESSIEDPTQNWLFKNAPKILGINFKDCYSTALKKETLKSKLTPSASQST